MFLIVPLLVTRVARVAGGGFLYYEAGPSAARGDNSDLNGFVDDLRLTDVRIVFFGRNLVFVVF